MKKRRILIVDDQPVNRRILKKILADTYEILEAENGAEALKLLAENLDVSAVLLDIMMPVMNGYQVLETMGRDPELSRIPVIVSSQKEGDESEIRALSLGAQDFIAKPYKVDIIRHRLENTIKLRETAAVINRVEKDELTGLYNKQFFMEKAEEELKNHPDQKYDLICFGVERFKLINDTYGMEKGDALLKYLAKLTVEITEGKALCSRFMSDMFYILIPHTREYTNEDFKVWFERVQEFPVDMDIKLHCGIYVITDASASVGVMCDRAMLAADKNRGKYDASFCYYDDALRQKLLEEQFITSTMQTALEQEQFVVYMQPKYDLHTEMIAGAEALVRWIHPEKGFMSPGEFIPLFERNGFITQLDRYVWERTCKSIRQWLDRGLPPVPVSVNVSRADIFNPKLADILLGLLKKYEIPIGYLHLEITESAYTDNPGQIIQAVGKLHDLGFVIEMDDFGSGYSSLNMLAEMPVDVLKLDMRFVQNEASNTSGKGIMSFVISLAKWMKLAVVAEGVETAEQIASLRSMDCGFVQGYYYARPMEEKAFAELLSSSAVTELESTRERSQAEGKNARQRHEGRVMLIVDDIEVNRDILAEVFSKEYRIEECENGKLALEYLEKHYEDVDVILLDLLMPVMDGFQVLSELRKNERTRMIPVIVTSQGDVKAEQKALECGANDFVSKPYSPQVVSHRVHNVTDSCKLQKLQLRELDEVKQREQALVEESTQNTAFEQMRYRYILDNLDVAYFEKDYNGAFYASEKYSLYVISDSVKDHVLEEGGDYSGIFKDDIPVLFEFFRMRNQKLPSAAVTLRLKMRDGSFRWTEMLGFFEYEEDGSCRRYTGVLRDVDSEWQQQNRKLQEALGEAEKASQAKTDFLSRVSHDMRTPLNGILGLTALLAERVKDNKPLSMDVEQINQSGHYLLNLINDTLDVSQIESGRMELHPSVCDGKTAFINVISMVRPSMDLKDIRFRLKADNLPFTRLYIDVGRVEQAIMNIMSNAIKFTPEGGTIEMIMENLSNENGIITDRLIIRDNGIGMSKAFMEHLFEPFAQEHNDNRSIYHGTGLGMTIAKQCMELMGGSISVTSQEGKGTEVVLVLPMPIATEQQIAEYNEEKRSRGGRERLKGRRVLLCEDHPLNTTIATRILNKVGVKVEHAENGQVGVDMFRSSANGYYDAILMDIRMPVMDGLEAARQIRDMDRAYAQSVPIIAMTANAFREDVKNAINAGMNEHLGKPVEPEKLYDTLLDFINRPKPYEGRKVLVVDDVEVNRVAIRAAIEPVYEVLEATNGKEALLVLKEQPDVAAVITDIQMPEMDGRQLIRRIRENREFEKVAILANTNYGDYRQEEELLNMGANDFIYKPTSPRVVRMRLEHILHNWSR